MAHITKLGFLENLPVYEDTQPYQILGLGEHDAKTNCVFRDKQILVHDARPHFEDFEIGKHGFQFLRHNSNVLLEAKHCEAGEENPIVIDYLKETIGLTKEVFKSENVVCFDWRFRRNSPDSQNPVHDIQKARVHALPVAHNAHCDLSYTGGYDRLGLHLLPQELQEVESQRARCIVVNIWRPLKVVENAPLLLADRRSVQKSDLLEVDRVMIDKIEKGFLLTYSTDHKWYYLSNQRPDEITIFKSWGPQEPGPSIDFPPHGACSLETAFSNPRESIEVRMIVFLPNTSQG